MSHTAIILLIVVGCIIYLIWTISAVLDIFGAITGPVKFNYYRFADATLLWILGTFITILFII